VLVHCAAEYEDLDALIRFRVMMNLKFKKYRPISDIDDTRILPGCLPGSTPLFLFTICGSIRAAPGTFM